MMTQLPLRELSELSTLYSQSHRYYHNIDHINFCLGQLEQAYKAGDGYLDKVDQFYSGLLHQPSTRRVVTYAIWYHDAVYNPYSSENEQASELLFRQQHTTYSSPLSSQEQQEVSDAILATAHHTEHQQGLSFSTNLMLDIDLAGLGQSWDIFSLNGESIWMEYRHVGNEAFLDGRIRFFKALMERPQLYYTKWFYDKYENTARNNVDMELNRLYNL